MITFYAPGKAATELDGTQRCPELTRDAIWIDLLSPSDVEEQALEAALGIDIPTREELQQIELSSRLYEENENLFMTATVLTHADTSTPQSSAVTFILTDRKLITLRYEDPAPFRTFRARREASLMRYQTGDQCLAGIVDAIVERAADILEGVGANLDRLSLRVFEPVNLHAIPHGIVHSKRGRARRARQRDFVDVLRLIGAASDLVSRARESLVSFTRLVTFLREARGQRGASRDSLAHVKTILGDLASLSDHASFLSSKIGFLLDATLGMINNEQNAIIKILSVAALVFLPPTLVAGVYGMNFEFMPELKWAYGYPFALTLMLISAVTPYLFFRRRGWL
jgi:magnesium transporter